MSFSSKKPTNARGAPVATGQITETSALKILCLDVNGFDRVRNKFWQSFTEMLKMCDVFAAVETKLKLSDQAIELPGCKSIQKRRKQGAGGGIAVHAKEPLELTEIETDRDDILCTKVCSGPPEAVLYIVRVSFSPT